MTAAPRLGPVSAGWLELVESAGFTRLRLRVKPGSKRNAVLGVRDGALKLGVVARPERGKANRAVLKLLAAALGVPPSAITIVAGEASQDKTVLVRMARDAISRRLAPADGGD